MKKKKAGILKCTKNEIGIANYWNIKSSRRGRLPNNVKQP